MTDTTLPAPPFGAPRNLEDASCQTMIERVKRRVAPLATTAVCAAAAMSVAGCAMGGSGSNSAGVHELLDSEPVTLTSQAKTPEARAAEQKAQAYASDIQLALDQTDRNRLAAAERKAQQAAAAVAAANAASSQSKVILASSTTEEAGAKASQAAAMPVTVARMADPAPVAVTPVTEPVKPVAPVVKEEAVKSVAAAAAPAPVAPVKPMVKAEEPSTPVAMPSAVIAPITVVPSQAPSAMGSMVATAGPAVMEKAAEAPTPAVATPAPPAEPTLDEAMAVVRKDLGAKPTLNTALALALLDTQGKTDELLATLPEADQKVANDLLAALQGMNAKTGTGATIAERAAPLVDAAKKWQGEADLQLPKLVLATRVDSFGVYNAIEPKFEQGKQHTVIIYCEVANFNSKKNDDGWYETKLSQQETLITDDGLLVWRPNAEEIEDKSMNQRHDFYLVKKLTIPGNLAAGKYVLRMSVTDRNTNKLSMVSLPVEILAK